MFVCSKYINDEDRELECDRLEKEYSQNFRPMKEEREHLNLKIVELHKRSHQLIQANDNVSQNQKSRYEYPISYNCVSKHGSSLQAAAKNWIDEDGWNCSVLSST